MLPLKENGTGLLAYPNRQPSLYWLPKGQPATSTTYLIDTPATDTPLISDSLTGSFLPGGLRPSPLAPGVSPSLVELGGGWLAFIARVFLTPRNSVFITKNTTSRTMTNPNPRHSPLRIAWDAARVRGDKTFTYDQPCRNGHANAPRYTMNGVCLRCAAENNRTRKHKPDHLRQLKLTYANGRVTQLTQDRATIADTEAAKEKLFAITGRPVSLSLMHKAGMHLLNAYLSNAPAASSVMALFS